MKKTWIIVLVVIALLLVWGWRSYNKLVTENESVTNQWAQVESQYQRRLDLIPNLVESVKGVMQQEKDVFGAIAAARTKYGQASTADQKAVAATEVESALSRLLVVMENYPQLKSSENVQTLMAQLEGTENRISVERQRYNDAVKIFDVMIKRIPTQWIAGILGFSPRDYFQAESAASSSPKVDLKLE